MSRTIGTVLLLATLLVIVHAGASVNTNDVDTKNGGSFPFLANMWRGRDGRDGKDGKDGLNGRDGIPGARGNVGPAGAKGERGLVGPQGPPGQKGESGGRGEQGPPGVKGNDGSNGPQGPPGMSSQLFCKSLPADVCGECSCFDDHHNPKRYDCDCTHLAPQRDCLKFLQDGHKMDGIYRINPSGKIIVAPCDMTTDHGGWTIFQRRVDASTNFYRDWVDYKVGFGSLSNNLWLGNEHIHALSLQARPKMSTLRFEMTTFDHVFKWAAYEGSEVRGEDEKFKLKLGKYSGDAGDSMAGHNNKRFTTYDADNDDWSSNCAQRYAGGWWYGACHHVHLNGVYFYPYESKPATALEIDWNSIGNDKPLKKTEIKIRREV